MNTRNHRNLCKGIEKVAGFTSSGQGGERFICDRSNGRFADGNVGLTNLDKFPMWLIWQQICGFANGNVGLTNLDKLKNVEKLVFRWDPDKISLQDLFCAGYMLCEMVVREQETQVFTFRDDSWLRHDWRILKLGLWEVDTFSDSRNCEYHRRVGFWVQAPEGDWARGWQKYGEESCVIKRFCPKQGFGWIVFTGKLFQRQLPALYETDSCSSCAKVSEHNVIIL